MNNCGTCRHWDNSDLRDNGKGECRGIPGGGWAEPEALAYVFGEVYTLPDFGCVLHELRPELTPPPPEPKHCGRCGADHYNLFHVCADRLAEVKITVSGTSGSNQEAKDER